MNTMKPENPHRSIMIMPVNKDKFIAKAYTRDADIIMLDLEDSIATKEKAHARDCVKDAIPVVARGGADVWVRINGDTYREDLEASVWPGLNCLFLPKVESPWEVMEIEEEISRLEKQRGIPERTVRTHLGFETPRGYLNMKEIAAASRRAISMNIGQEDLSSEIGIALKNGDELEHYNREMVVVALAFGLKPIGLTGSVSDFGDTEALGKIVEFSRKIGLIGSFCIHPAQVEVLNNGFAPRQADVNNAKAVVEKYIQSKEKGDGAVGLGGKMVDLPVVQKAQALLDKVERIAEFQRYKQGCVSSFKKSEQENNA